MNTRDVTDALKVRHPVDKGEWAVMLEVADNCSSPHRWADCIAVNLWGSRGHALHGYEVKVSRSDWLMELRAPEKADVFVRRCDYWTVAVPACEKGSTGVWERQNIAAADELPKGWGLAVWNGSRWHNAVRATRNVAVEPLPVTMWAALLRRAAQGASQAELKEAEQRGYERARAKLADTHDREMRRVQATAAGASENLAALEQAMGTSFHLARNWANVETATKVGDAIRTVMAMEDIDMEIARRLEGIQHGLTTRLEQVAVLIQDHNRPR